MKITAIEAVPLAIPLRPMNPPSPWTGGTRKQIFVRVHTDEGVSGLGEAFAYGAPLAVVSVIEESLAPLIVGQPVQLGGSSTTRTTYRLGEVPLLRRPPSDVL